MYNIHKFFLMNIKTDTNFYFPTRMATEIYCMYFIE